MNEEEYLGYFADCYVLTKGRSKKLISEFLETFVPKREEMAGEYEVPQYNDEPLVVFMSDEELIDYLIENINEPHSIYWENKEESDLRFAMCFFTNDGNIILGLSTEAKSSNSEIEDAMFDKLKHFASSSEGLITYENPAPCNTEEFRKMINHLNS